MRKAILGLAVVLLLAVAAAPAYAEDANWTARYWDNTKLSGSPLITRAEPSINHNWGSKSPDPAIHPNHFSVRWTRTVNFAAGTYLFHATSDDGIRMWVDGKKIIDQWTNHPIQTIVVPMNMTAGDHALKVEYYENVNDAIAIVVWAPVAPDAWKVNYYKGTALKSPPAVTRFENTLKYYWNATNPVPGVAVTNFSARWVGTQTMATTGNFRFKVTASGGFRLYVDNELIMNEWFAHNGSASTAKAWLDAGDHVIRLDFFNRSKKAMLILGIK